MSESCGRCGTPNPTGRLGLCPRCMFSHDPAPTIAGGSIEILEVIGRGGMGTVHKARHLRLGRTVAVKFLPPELDAQPEFRARFEREARALALLNHPNIVAVHDSGEDEGRAYIVMEYVDGKPVDRLAPEAAIDVALQVCDALAYAHAQGVVHRDIKPQNVLVDASGRVKVADFGIARIARPGWTVTTDGTIGTPPYMAPEAIAGAPPDPRMDIYSLGVLLYQVSTGRLPIGHFDPAPAPLDAIVRRALASDPARRYASALEMRRDLESARGTSDDLPRDEKTFLHAVAVLQAISTAVALWAFLMCVTPRVILRGEIMPLVVIAQEELPDGRIVTRARFETWPVLAALATFGLAITAYGFLRRHWRLAGLERSQPDRSVRETGCVLLLGAAAMGVYGARLLLESQGYPWAANYAPILGGAIEVATLFFVWVSILQAWRTSRPLRREPMLWFGFALALYPPIHHLLGYLRDWHP